MDLSSFDLFFNIISFAAGTYCIYTWFKLVQSKQLFQSQVLIPKDKTPAECIDEEEYIRYMQPRLLIFGLVFFLDGAFRLLDSKLGLLDRWLAGANGTVTLIAEQGDLWLCAICVIWFGVCWMRALKKYW